MQAEFSGSSVSLCTKKRGARNYENEQSIALTMGSNEPGDHASLMAPVHPIVSFPSTVLSKERCERVVQIQGEVEKESTECGRKRLLATNA